MNKGRLAALLLAAALCLCATAAPVTAHATQQASHATQQASHATQQTSLAAQNVSQEEGARQRLEQVRLELWDTDDAAGRLAREHRASEQTPQELTDYYREAVELERRATELTDEMTTLRDELTPAREDPPGAWGEKLRDAQSRRRRCQRSQQEIRDGAYSATRKADMELLPLVRLERSIAGEIDMIKWQSVTAGGIVSGGLEEELWEARYAQELAHLDRTALENAFQAGSVNRRTYDERNPALRLRQTQAANRVEQAEDAIAKHEARSDGVMSEEDFGDYYVIVERLEQIDRELERMNDRFESGSLDFSEYKTEKKALEAEREELRAKRRAYRYNQKRP